MLSFFGAIALFFGGALTGWYAHIYRAKLERATGKVAEAANELRR